MSVELERLSDTQVPTQYQVIPPVQNTMGGGHLHTPPSIFQHMMGQHNAQQEPGSWNHVPQVPPMYMPWSVPGLQQPQLVRFTGERPPQACGSMMHQKRKLDPEIVETRQTKQFISEEKMAAHFRNMHISSNYSPTPVELPPACPPQLSTDGATNVEMPVDTPVTLDDGKSMHPRLVISEELKRLQSEPLLPASLLSKLERPSMALVLWEPPSKHLRLLSSRQQPSSQPSTSSSEEDDNNNNINNNDEQIADLNESNYPSNSIDLEPMDV